MQAVTLYKCENLIVENLAIKNAQQIHVNVQESTNIKVAGVTVSAPEHSPNTDGIHITNTKTIKISDSVIATGTYIYVLFFELTGIYVLIIKYN